MLIEVHILVCKDLYSLISIYNWVSYSPNTWRVRWVWLGICIEYREIFQLFCRNTGYIIIYFLIYDFAYTVNSRSLTRRIPFVVNISATTKYNIEQFQCLPGILKRLLKIKIGVQKARETVPLFEKWFS